MWSVDNIKSDREGTLFVATLVRDDYRDTCDLEAITVRHFCTANELRDQLPLELAALNKADVRRQEKEVECEALRREFGLDGKRSCERDESCCQ